MEIDRHFANRPAAFPEEVAVLWLEDGRIVSSSGPVADFLGRDESPQGEALTAVMASGVVPAAAIEAAMAEAAAGRSHSLIWRRLDVPRPWLVVLEREGRQLRVSFRPFRLSQILDNTTTLVFVKDPEGRYVLVNREFLERIGRAEHEVIGRTDFELIDPQMAAGYRRVDREVLETCREIETEEHARKGERRTTYLVRKFALCDEGGRAYALCGMATDISRRKLTENALKNVALGVSGAVGSDVFRAIVEKLGETLSVDFAFIAQLDEGGRRLDVLAAWNRGELTAPMSYDVADTPCRFVLGEGFQYYSGDAQQCFPADGMFRTFGFHSYTGVPLKDSAGEPLGVLSVAHSQRLPEPEFLESILQIFAVRAAAELEHQRALDRQQQMEESYRTMFETAEDGIYIHDIDTGYVVDVNPTVYRSYGYSREELLSKRFSDLGSGEYPHNFAGVAKHIERARQGEVQRYEWHRRNRDGSLHWDQIVMKRVRLGGVDRLISYSRDITDLKRREEALSQSEDRLRATVEAALDSIITMDADGRILGFNPAAEDCFGIHEEEAVGRKLSELIIPERYRRAHERGMARYLREGSGPYLGRRIETWALRSDGSEFPIELAIGVARGAEGEIFIGYLRDITQRHEAEAQRKRLEGQLRQAQKMEALGHLTGGVAHDFNNILTGIMGYLSMGADRAADLGDDTMVRYLERANRSAEKARVLIQQMLTFSRGQKSRPRALALESVVAEALDLMRSTIPSTVHFRPLLPGGTALVRMDPVQIEQIIMNLCINARDAMGGAGEITVAVENAGLRDAVCSSCRHPVDGDYVELSVADEGPGIGDDLLDRLFEPFFSTKETGRGTGMGLAMVHGIVHEHGGHILVDRAPGGGACLRILLPALHGAVPDEDAPASGIERDTSGLRGHVLLVEDQDSVREFMIDRLESWGLDVTAYRDPLAALRAIEDGCGAHFGLFDQSMASMTGLDLAERVRLSDHPFPVAIYTGYAEDLHEARLRAAGVVEVLRKPIDQQRVFELLREHIAAD
jgi:PAS domain S-box-containing protein